MARRRSIRSGPCLNHLLDAKFCIVGRRNPAVAPVNSLGLGIAPNTSSRTVRSEGEYIASSHSMSYSSKSKCQRRAN